MVFADGKSNKHPDLRQKRTKWSHLALVGLDGLSHCAPQSPVKTINIIISICFGWCILKASPHYFSNIHSVFNSLLSQSTTAQQRFQVIVSGLT